MDRPNGGFGRGYSQGNGVGAQQALTDRPQPDRQEEDWSTPTNVERREDTERHKTAQLPPQEERLYCSIVISVLCTCLMLHIMDLHVLCHCDDVWPPIVISAACLFNYTISPWSIIFVLQSNCRP